MTLETFNALIRLTIALGVCTYGAAEYVRFTRGPGPTARALWTLALALTVAHGLLAYHTHYGWSQGVAYADTARKLDAAFGWSWGGGLFVNYGFYLLWIADAAWWWIAPRRYRARPRVVNHLVSAVLVFIFFNGTVVFAAGPIRVVGASVIALVAYTWYRSRVGARLAPARSGV